MLADGLPNDLAAGIEDTRHDRSVAVRYVALENGGAVHHRNACDADVVLDRDPLAAECTIRCPCDRAAPVPGVERVLLRWRSVAGRSRVLDRRHRLSELVEPAI